MDQKRKRKSSKTPKASDGFSLCHVWQVCPKWTNSVVGAVKMRIHHRQGILDIYAQQTGNSSYMGPCLGLPKVRAALTDWAGWPKVRPTFFVQSIILQRTNFLPVLNIYLGKDNTNHKINNNKNKKFNNYMYVDRWTQNFLNNLYYRI